MNNKSQSAKDLRTWIRESDLTISEVGGRVGRSTRTVASWLSGQTLPRIDDAVALKRLSKGDVALEGWVA